MSSGHAYLAKAYIRLFREGKDQPHPGEKQNDPSRPCSFDLSRSRLRALLAFAIASVHLGCPPNRAELYTALI